MLQTKASRPQLQLNALTAGIAIGQMRLLIG